MLLGHGDDWVWSKKISHNHTLYFLDTITSPYKKWSHLAPKWQQAANGGFCKFISFQTYLTHRQLALARARQLSNFFGIFFCYLLLFLLFLLFVPVDVTIVVVVVIIFVLVVILVLLCWGESSLACRRERALTAPATLQINTQQKTHKHKHIKHTNYQNDVHKTNTRKYTKHGNLIDKHNSVNKFLKSNRTRIKKEEWSVKSNTN